jgi:protein dithiol oxidoreductase (disulfide-forming)
VRRPITANTTFGGSMPRLAAVLLIIIACAALLPEARAAERYVEGRDYYLITPAQATTVPPGKVEVMEVFSYGCPVCNTFQPTMEGLRRVLPANAQIVLLPAAFNPAEDWPMFQRAYITAQLLGVAERAHQGIFDAVWKSGELATTDPSSHTLKSPQPSLEQAAKVYARLTGVKPETFLATAHSFSVDMKIKAADAQILAMQVDGTPCLIVNGKYRVNNRAAVEGGPIELVKFLVAKESGH